MTELYMEDIQAIGFELLKKIKQICVENNLRYFLAYGTLIGAVRHQGFIPWDDDIDIAMPREDYNKFIECCKNYDINIVCHETNSEYVGTFLKVHMENTLIVPDNVGMRVPFGVYIDVFPLDGLGNTKEQASEKIKSFKILHYINRANCAKRYYQLPVKKPIQVVLKYGVYVVSKISNRQKIYEKIDKMSKEHKFDDSKFVGICEGVYYQREIMRHEDYAYAIEQPFEGESFSIPVGYDVILTNIYGDYMTPPPPEKRVPKHDFKAYRLED